jgi:hypothetical protein
MQALCFFCRAGKNNIGPYYYYYHQYYPGFPGTRNEEGINPHKYWKVTSVMCFSHNDVF